MAKTSFIFFMTQTNNVPFRAASHNHTCYELVYYLSGRGILTINSKEYEYGPNTFTIIEPQAYHGEKAIEDTEIMYFGFSNIDNEKYIKSGLYKDFDSQDILNVLHIMKNEIQNQKSNYLKRMEILTQDILVLFERLTQDDNAYNLSNPLENAAHYIDLNFTTNIDMHALASLSGYSYHRFRHIFKEHFGLSPKQYILNRQLEYATELLKHSDKSIEEISIDCGFSSCGFFIQCFSKRMGTTPKKFRKDYLSNQMNIEYIDS